MTPKTITVIALRLLAVYVAIQMIASFAISLYGLMNMPELSIFDAIKSQLLMFAVYFLLLFVLFKYSEHIASKITQHLPDDSVGINLGSVELLATLIAAGGLLSIVASIPMLINQLTSVVAFWDSELAQTLPLKRQLTQSAAGLLGATIEVAVTVVLVMKAKQLAQYWDNIQRQAP